MTDLYFWPLSQDDSVDSLKYTECLKEILIDQMNKLYPSGWRLVHDNPRIHTSFITQNFLEESGVKVIQHPPYSPDLNPIEKVWGYLKSKVMT